MSETAREVPRHLRVVSNEEGKPGVDEVYRKFESIDEVMEHADVVATDADIEAIFRRIDTDHKFARRLQDKLPIGNTKYGVIFGGGPVHKQEQASDIEHNDQEWGMKVQAVLESYLDNVEPQSARQRTESQWADGGTKQELGLRLAFMDKDRNLRLQNFRPEMFEDEELAENPDHLGSHLYKKYNLNYDGQYAIEGVLNILDAVKEIEEEDAAKEQGDKKFEKL